MRKPLFCAILVLGLCCLAASRAKAQQTYEYSEIAYDDSTNTVQGYSATEVDYYTSYSYDAYVEGYLYDQSDNLLDSGYAEDSYLAEVYTSASADPDIEYTVDSYHDVIAVYYYEEIDKSPDGCWPCDGCNTDCYYFYDNTFWYDPFGFSSLSPGYYGSWWNLFGDGPPGEVENDEYDYLGSTSASVHVCSRPNGETTATNVWDNANNRPTIHRFTVTALPTTTSFSGRSVTERDAGGGGPDTCWFTGSAADKWEIITINTGTVNSNNQYGDLVGWYPDKVTYYRSQGRAPCGTTLQQRVALYCDISLLFFKYNTLEASFTATQVTSVRDGVSITRTWP